MVYDFLRSIKLAVVLILVIIVLALFGSTMENFFSTPLFLFPVGFFFLNLSVCTFHRIRSRIKSGAKKRFGPDILHIGLLVMIIGGVISATGRQEGGAWLSAGDRIDVPGDYTLILEDFRFLKYENGSPRDWISTVTVEKEGKILFEHRDIEVNKPLKLGNVKIYQASYYIEEENSINASGLHMVIDPGYYPILAGLLLLALGLFITYIQKTGDDRI